MSHTGRRGESFKYFFFFPGFKFLCCFAKSNEGWEVDVKGADTSRSDGSEQRLSGPGEKIKGNSGDNA